MRRCLQAQCVSAMELRASLSYRRDRRELGYWRSVHQHEVDFTVGEDLLQPRQPNDKQ